MPEVVHCALDLLSKQANCLSGSSHFLLTVQK
jgi:hypothetical protein